MEPKIKAVKFVDKDYQREAIATMTDGSEQYAFRFYADELDFSEWELIGLTIDEAKRLYTRKDIEYLRS